MKLSQQLPLATLLGCSLLLLLTTTTTTLTLAQNFTTTTICDPTPDAENACDIDTEYCSATSSTCIAIGSCADDVVDCNNLNNGPYPALMCMGTMECKEGMCLMNCGEFDDPTKNETETETETLSTSCNTSAECISFDFENNSDLSESFMDGEYCGTDSTCLSMGDCLVIDDCMHSDNVFPVAACMGNMECTDEGQCSMNCGPNDNDALFGCSSSSDCPGGIGIDYCTSNGICVSVGSCVSDTDCTNNIDNSPFAIAMCIGTLECSIDGTCSQICDTGDTTGTGDGASPPAEEEGEEEEEVPTNTNYTPCRNNNWCDIDNEYCDTINDVCLQMGACNILDDCTDMNNVFAIVQCVGTLSCTDGQCTKICDGTDSDEGEIDEEEIDEEEVPTGTGDGAAPPAEGEEEEGEVPTNTNYTPCRNNNWCDIDNEYCDTINDVCLQMGQCNILDDCTDMNNVFAIVQCVGTLSCTDGQCTKICDGTDSDEGEIDEEEIDEEEVPTTPCRTMDECSDDGTEYCDAIFTGICLKMGSCNVISNCLNRNNLFATEQCIGTLSCIDNQCSIICNTNGSNGDGSGSDPMSTTCTTDTDCNTYAGTDLVASEERAGDIEGDDGSIGRNGSYCAQGVCMDMGSCNDNSDCSNPINLFDDIRCAGYLSCGSDDIGDGLCTRNCGELCEDGSRQVQCTVNPCDVNPCPGAVSCIADYCGNSCTAVYYGSSGEASTDCEYFDETAATTTISSSSSSNGEVYASKEGGAVATMEEGVGATSTSAVSGGASFYQKNTIVPAASAIVMASSLLLIISIL